MAILPSVDSYEEYVLEEDRGKENPGTLFISPVTVRDMESIKSPRDLISKVVGWKNMTDAKGNEIPFSVENRGLLKQGWFNEIVDFIQEISGVNASEKND